MKADSKAFLEARGFGKDDIELLFAYVAGTLPSLGHVVQFAVLSATALSVSRVILKPLKHGGFSTEGIELLAMEAVELPLRKRLGAGLFLAFFVRGRSFLGLFRWFSRLSRPF